MSVLYLHAPPCARVDMGMPTWVRPDSYIKSNVCVCVCVCVCVHIHMLVYAGLCIYIQDKHTYTHGFEARTQTPVRACMHGYMHKGHAHQTDMCVYIMCMNAYVCICV
jgi:hypothetical protein